MEEPPYTAVQAVHHLTAVLADAARRSFTSRQLLDDASRPRVTIPIMDFPTHLRVVCSHARKGGSERHPRVHWSCCVCWAPWPAHRSANADGRRLSESSMPLSLTRAAPFKEMIWRRWNAPPQRLAPD